MRSITTKAANHPKRWLTTVFFANRSFPILALLCFGFAAQAKHNPFFGAPNKEYHHWANGGSVKTNTQWDDGALQQTNSHYVEGDIVSHAYTPDTKNWLPNSQHSIVIQYDNLLTKNNATAGGFSAFIDNFAPPSGFFGETPGTTNGFYSTNINVTNVTQLSDGGSGGQTIKRIQLDFTFTGNKGDNAALYFGLRLAVANEVTNPSNGAGSWPGASLQTSLDGDGSRTLSINLGPVVTCSTIGASVSADNNSVCKNDAAPTVTFSASGITPPYTFSYTDPNGNPQTISTSGNSSTVTLQVSTSTPGTYTYTLTHVAGQFCDNDVSGSVSVVVKDISSKPTVQDVNYCLGETSSPLTATGDNLTWYDANGNPLSGAPTPATTTAGTTDYYVTQTTTGECESEHTKITVTVNPKASISNQTPNAICNGGSVSLDPTTFTGSNTVPSGTTYSWLAPSVAGLNGLSGGTDQASFSTGTLTNTTTAPIKVTYTLTPKSGDCNGASFTVDVTVNPTPTANTPDNQVVCAGGLTTAVTFTGGVSGTSFAWTNDNTAIGLAASGTGDIAAFNATNGSPSPITGNISVTPSANGCTGSPAGFSITVNPTPTANSIGGRTHCHKEPGAAIVFAGTATSFNWTSTADVGFGTSGTGVSQIDAYTANNTGAANVTATITVTPLYAANAVICTGAATTFTVTVKPLPNVDFTNSGLCASTPVTFTAQTSAPAPYQWNVNSVLQSGTVSTLTINNGAAGSSYSVKLAVQGANGCSNSVEKALTATGCTQYTLTQGFFGSTNGKACPDNALAVDILNKWLTPSGRTIGNATSAAVLSNVYNTSGKGKFTINSNEGSTLNGMMPGGSTPNRINASSASVAYTTGTIPKSNGKITDVLITQTITLGVNIGRFSDLANVIVEPNKYATVVRSATKCVIPTTCSGGTITSSKMSGVSTAFVTLVNGKYIQYLYDLANDALGGVALPSGISYSDVNTAIDFYNKLFDGGVLYLGNYACQQTTCNTVCTAAPVTVRLNAENLQLPITKPLGIIASPNPYNDKLRFTVTAPEQGYGSLEVFNTLGQKIKVVYSGIISAGTHTYEFEVPEMQRTNFIYLFRLGDKLITGKAIQLKQ